VPVFGQEFYKISHKMCSLAGKAGVAAGTVYNYFSNKDEILLALTEEYWRQALLEMKTEITAVSF